MAQVAIPLILLGGAYVLSNQDSSKKSQHNNNKDLQYFSPQSQSRSNVGTRIRENFQPNNRNKPEVRAQQLPNTNTPLPNYPVSVNSPMNGIAQQLMKSEPEHYDGTNNATELYFQQAAYEAQAENDTMNQFTSLNGSTVSKYHFKHNNMVPYFGSNVRQNTDPDRLDGNEARLDAMNGSGSQHFRKQETAPMFQPQENLQWGSGMPSTSDFVQSRMNPSTSMANVKPFQEIRVGPGLGGAGGGVLGSGGFNSGMEARDLWMDKNVDQLRTQNNPKVTYSGVTLGGKYYNTERGHMGKMEKYLPDTYYINTPERYFTTTGVEKAQTARSTYIMPEENRATTTQQYFGGSNQASNVEAPYVKGTFFSSNRPELAAPITHISNAHAPNKTESTTGDYGIIGYKNSVLPNNRTLTGQTGGTHEYGGVFGLAKAMVAPIMDVLRPSRKENVIGNARPTGIAGSNITQAAYVYNPAARAKTTIREMTENRPDHQFINNQRESGGYGYAVKEVQPVGQERDTTSIQYMGGGGNTTITSNATLYDAAYNAHLIDKEPISQGRTPMGSSVKMFNGQSYMNVEVDKLECDRNNNRMYVPQQLGYGATPSVQQIGATTARTEYGQEYNTQRIAPDMMQNLQSNPYVHRR
jgi:hypothetical protein